MAETLTETLLVPAEPRGCFLCNVSVELMLSYMRDGSWRFCENHMRQIAREQDRQDEQEPIHAI